jgi:hypothetical protein
MKMAQMPASALILSGSGIMYGAAFFSYHKLVTAPGFDMLSLFECYI